MGDAESTIIPVKDHGKLTGLDDDDHSLYQDSGEVDAKIAAHKNIADAHHQKFEAADADAKIAAHNESTTFVHGLKKRYTISDDILHSHDSVASTTSTSYVKLKTITIDALCPSPVTLRVYFELGRDSGGSSNFCYARIYKNGAAYGSERSTNAIGSWVAFSEDLSFAAGDTIELWAYTDNSANNSKVQNFRVLGKIVDVTLQIAIEGSCVGSDNPFSATNS